MSRFSTRVAVLFALAATVPVALTGIVWMTVSGRGASATTSEAAMVRAQLSTLDAQRKAAVNRLCRDDLAIDKLLEERVNESPSTLDYDRLFRASMEAAGFQALWVLDSLSGEVVASGHRSRVVSDGADLTRQARSAGDRAYLVTLGNQEHQTFLVRSCSIARGGARLTIIGGHRVSDLRDIDPEQLVLTSAAGARDEVVAELTNAEGASQGSLVWRPGLDRRGPPLLLWVACVVGLALGLALIFGGYLNRWLQSSVNELTAAATRVGRGDFDTTLRDGATGAFPATATAFNKMTRDLRDAREQLRQTERIAAWQEIAKSLAHELKNPLSPIRLSIETLRKARERSHEDFDEMFDESTKTILQEVERLRNIVDEFSRFARLPAPQRRETDLREVLAQAASLHSDGEAPVTADLPRTPVAAFVDADQITQVLHNLLQNAQDAAREAHPSGGAAVTLRLRASAGTVTIEVEDNGVGVAEGQAETIFEPYYTRKQGGTGLGLAITERIVTEHGGRIDLDSRPGRTVFTIVIPQG